MLTSATAPIDRVLTLLPDARRRGDACQWDARCPAHDDRRASLSVGVGDDGRVLLACMANCSTLTILQRLGLRWSDLFPANRPPRVLSDNGRLVAEYDYRDQHGELLYQICRFDPKDFRPRRPDGRGGWIWNLRDTPRILYRLPELLASDDTVFIAEGEKDVDALASLGLTATCNPGGAAKWQHLSDDSALAGRRIVVIADADDVGREHAAQIARRLCSRAEELRVLELPGAKDASDWIAAGGTAEQLAVLVESKPRWTASDDHVLVPGAHGTDNGTIEVGTDDFARETLERLPEDLLYRKDVAVGVIHDGAFRLAEVNELRILIDRGVTLRAWIKRKDDEPVCVFRTATRDLASLIAAAAITHPRVRNLTCVTNFPVFGPDWRLCQPGYADGIYYDRPRGLSDLRPVRHVGTIRRALDELITDFPFRGPADVANFVGLLLTPLIRPAIDDNVPLHLVMAPLERTGKSKLVEQVFGRVITGRDLPASQLPEREEEIEKRILSLLLADQPIMLLDNIRARIESPSLASLLTSRRFVGRVLGVSRIVTLPNNLTLVATANNPSASGEIAKRSIPIRLQPADDQPEARCDFVHPDLPAYVDQVRPHVLACLIGAVELWVQAGRQGGAAPLGGFERWSAAVGGILKMLGYTEWRANEHEWLRAADPYGEDLRALVEYWSVRSGGQAMSPSDLADMAKTLDVFADCFLARTERGCVVAFTRRVLRPNVDRPIGAHRLRMRSSGNQTTYLLEDAG